MHNYLPLQVIWKRWRTIPRRCWTWWPTLERATRLCRRTATPDSYCASRRPSGFVRSFDRSTALALTTTCVTTTSHHIPSQESRKLRVAAEQQAELERAVMRDIRQVLEAAKFQCATIVQQLKDNCMQQLDSIEPMRTPHREKMMGRSDYCS